MLNLVGPDSFFSLTAEALHSAAHDASTRRSRTMRLESRERNNNLHDSSSINHSHDERESLSVWHGAVRYEGSGWKKLCTKLLDGSSYVSLRCTAANDKDRTGCIRDVTDGKGVLSDSETIV
jgi:hypothetical protein